MYRQDLRVKDVENIIVDIKDKWMLGNKSISLKDYNLTADNLSLFISYPKQIRLVQKEEVNVCLIPNKAGNYNGILIFMSSSTGIATLISLNVSELGENNPSPITGAIIKSNETNNYETTIPVLLFLLSIVLLFVFFSIAKKKRQEIN